MTSLRTSAWEATQLPADIAIPKIRVSVDYHRSDIAGAENYFTRVLSNADRSPISSMVTCDHGSLGLSRVPPHSTNVCSTLPSITQLAAKAWKKAVQELRAQTPRKYVF